MVWGIIRRLLGLEPDGYSLVRFDGRRHNRIRGDLIPPDSLVVVQDGRFFVRTNRKDESGFAVYREDHRTFVYLGED